MTPFNKLKTPINGRDLMRYALKPAPKLIKFNNFLHEKPREGSEEWHQELLKMPIDEATEEKFVSAIFKQDDQYQNMTNPNNPNNRIDTR